MTLVEELEQAAKRAEERAAQYASLVDYQEIRRVHAAEAVRLRARAAHVKELMQAYAGHADQTCCDEAAEEFGFALTGDLGGLPRASADATKGG